MSDSTVKSVVVLVIVAFCASCASRIGIGIEEHLGLPASAIVEARGEPDFVWTAEDGVQIHAYALHERVSTPYQDNVPRCSAIHTTRDGEVAATALAGRECHAAEPRGVNVNTVVETLPGATVPDVLAGLGAPTRHELVEGTGTLHCLLCVDSAAVADVDDSGNVSGGVITMGCEVSLEVEQGLVTGGETDRRRPVLGVPLLNSG